jgi:hypothetical protein
LLAEAKKRKITADDNEIRQTIATNPIFARKGAFDKELYQSIITYGLHVQPRTYEEQVRHGIILSKLFQAITDSVTTTDAEIKEAYNKENEQISVSYIVSKPADFINTAAIDDAALKDYYEKQTQEFKKPASFNLEYLSFEGEHQVVGFNALKEQKGSFDAAVSAMNMQLKETGWFFLNDPIPGIGWVQEVSTTLAKMKAGDILPPVVVDKNYYVMRVKALKDPYTPEFEAVKDKVKEVVAGMKASQIAKTKIDQCLAKLKETATLNPQSVSFESTASEFGLKTNSTDPFKFGSYIQGLGGSDAFYTEAKKLGEKQFSDVIEMQGAYYIIKTKQIIPADETKFAQDKATFSEKITDRKKQKKFEEFIKELRKDTKRFNEPKFVPAFPPSAPVEMPMDAE